MAERDRLDWERGRDSGDRDFDRGRDRDREYHDRGMISRGSDEVRSWFGDDDARRRREMDEQRDREYNPPERNYGPNSERVRREHGWNRPELQNDRWESERGSSAYGDQRDFVGRSNDWSGSARYSPRGRDWYGPGYDTRDRPGWSGGARDYGDEDATRRQYRGDTGRYGAYGSQSSGYYGRDSGTTGEGRWGASYPSGARTFEPRGWSSSNWSSSGQHAGRGPRSYQRSDDRIREDVNEQLTADPRVDATEIEVRVQNGEVTLTGMVDERRTRRLAEEIIEDLPGVRDVRNELRVTQQRWNTEPGYALDATGSSQSHDDTTQTTAKNTGKR